MSDWTKVCNVDDIPVGTGVCALVAGEQVAVFRPKANDELYALGNFDPMSDAFVLSRGILGDKGGVLKVASPVYKHNYDLKTGKCLDEPDVFVPVYACRVADGVVEIGSSGRPN